MLLLAALGVLKLCCPLVLWTSVMCNLSAIPIADTLTSGIAFDSTQVSKCTDTYLCSTH